jgi:hypothetical protein
MMPSKDCRWSTPAEVKARVRRRWDRGEFLAESVVQGALYPLSLSIKGPTSSEITADFAAVQEWVAAWRRPNGVRCEWKTVGHRLFGANEMPTAASFDDAQDVVRFLGMHREWETFQEIVEHTRAQLPGILPWLARRSMQALALSADWERILSVVVWVRDHPRRGVYLRQVDLPGVHTKFIEGHRGVISELLEEVVPPATTESSARGALGFNRRYGFRDKPERIRFRYLDPSCSIEPSRLGLDLTVDSQAFAQLNPPVQRVFITENEINFLAFPDFPRSLIIFGSGYGWSALQGAEWLQHCEVHYWGDIDTHGFSILDQLRSVLPHAQSFLMDLATFEAFRHLCSTESTPAKRELQRLSPEERLLFDMLRRESAETTPRLEQERIPFCRIDAVLRCLGPVGTQPDSQHNAARR